MGEADKPTRNLFLFPQDWGYGGLYTSRRSKISAAMVIKMAE